MQETIADHNAGRVDGARIVLRVAINLGDVVIDRDDIHGDGVNVAARVATAQREAVGAVPRQATTVKARTNVVRIRGEFMSLSDPSIVAPR